MTWVITGAAGYIGAHVLRAFIEADIPCAAVDDLSTGFRERVPADVPFHEVDIRDRGALSRVFAKFDVEGVVHLAAKKSAPESVLKPDLYASVNLDGTRVLLDVCVEAGARSFVFSSTAAVYGTVESTRPIAETARTVPINPYGQTKLEAERLVEHAALAGRLDAVIFRYFNVGGAMESMLRDRGGENLIPLVLRALESDSVLPVYGTTLPTHDGTCIRDYVHVQDIASAHLAAAQALRIGALHFETINLGSGSGSSVLEVIAAAEAVAGRRLRWVAATQREGDPIASTCDMARAERILGWRASRTLQDIISTSR